MEAGRRHPVITARSAHAAQARSKTKPTDHPINHLEDIPSV